MQDLQVSFAWSFISTCRLIHPFATPWPSPPKGGARRDGTCICVTMPPSFRAEVRAGMIPSFHGASEREPRNLPPECCLAAGSFAWSFISPLALVHPFPLRGPSPQGETRRDGTPLLLLKHAKYSAELATFGGSPLSRFAGLSPRESVSHDSQVALLPYESCSLATPSGGQNKPLYVPPQSHVAQQQASIVPPLQRGERWWRQPPKGVPHFHRPPGRLYGFPSSLAH